MIISVPIAEWNLLEIGESVAIDLKPCAIALDGERTFVVLPHHDAYVSLSKHGPPVVSIENVLREAALRGVFLSNSIAT